MNDQHAHAGYGHDAYATGSFDSDPLFGALPGSYEAGHSGQYDSSQWDTGSHQTPGYDVYTAQQVQQPQQAQQFPQYDTSGQYDTTGQYNSGQHEGQYDTTGQYDASQYDTTGQWDAGAWNQTAQTGQYETAAATFAYDTTGQWAAPTFGTGTYDATAWNTGAEAHVPQQFTPQQEFSPAPEFTAEFTPEFTPEFTTEFAADAGYETGYENPAEFQPTDFQPDEFQPVPQREHEYDYEAEQTDTEHEQTEHEQAHEAELEPESEPEPESAPDLEPLAPVTPRPVRRSGGSRGRRRTPAKRSALLTVAVPSACVMGVAGIAAASVGGLGASAGEAKDDTTNLAAADPASVKPVAANSKIDTQLAALSADARDFGDRASRTQERLDLKARQEAEKKKRDDEAKRREAMRPKFVLPVNREGLSAYYGQAGVNWMSVHTGIDFPVSYGTEVMAATDGTVRTQYNSAYGNMAIVTAADGTETWYCHLSSTRIRSGSVKAGDVIAYSGNSGNSTGPHLHFEVRPGGGSAIDPLPWLRSHGLDPT
ncbi:M23 family metallopeptidase [Streptomyces lunaelactis]|uniref:M23 family metallopeptidase n=1 Tax=Streptomyces lunaelactis TaxID=1535768 RepID=UPI001584A8FE|nr:M23 family metallopeptidase [Streptomyces lunaelactis]NUK50459.1 M23 family metallopeptidase [Streptomyces lunaelactis]NUK65745.1 M23 family metallopeptidase [Streptomyces lunaelactis]